VPGGIKRAATVSGFKRAYAKFRAAMIPNN
jgi:hypothetical protein